MVGERRCRECLPSFDSGGMSVSLVGRLPIPAPSPDMRGTLTERVDWLVAVSYPAMSRCRDMPITEECDIAGERASCWYRHIAITAGRENDI